MRSIRAAAAALVFGLGAAALHGSCTTDRPRLQAKRISARAELIGGPRALGELGDWLLENDRVRIIVQDEGFSRGFGVFGGSLIDADLVRPGTGVGSSVGGTGKDNFGEMFPAFFVEAVEPVSVLDPNAPAGERRRLPAMEVERDGSDGEEAVLTVRGYGNDFLAMTQLANEVILGDSREQPRILFTTRYRLRPGVRYVEIETTIQNVTFPPERLTWQGAQQLLGAPLPAPLGDIALFGSGNSVFAPHEAGYDLRFRLERVYQEGGLELPAFPGLVLDFVATTGDDVSYGIVGAPPDDPSHNYALGTGQFPDAAPHSLHVPFVASAFTGMFLAAPPPLEPNDGQPGGDDELTYRRYLVVGGGDVASISDVAYELIGKKTGELQGRVLVELTQVPAAGAWVIVVDDQGRKLTQCTADADGRFRARLPSGRYTLKVRSDGQDIVTSAPVQVDEGRSAFVDLRAPAPARLMVTVVEEGVGPVPAKVTVVGTYGPEHAGEDTRDFLFDLSLGEEWRYTDLVDDDGADEGTRRFIESFAYTDDGAARLSVRPGTYEVVASRGLEYSLWRGQVTVTAGSERHLTAELRRVVDTSGYVSGDFHLHSIKSLDSSSSLTSRVRAYAGEGIEYAVSSDHNFVTDYAPAIAQQGLERFLNSAVGLELTTIDRGHYNGFPIRYEEGEPQAREDGRYDNTIASRTYGSFNWAGVTPQGIFDELRALARKRKVDPLCLGDECEEESLDVIVQVNHPRGGIGGYFDVYGLQNETLRPQGNGGLFAPQVSAHPEFAPAAFSWDFDAMEIVNGKRNEWLKHFRVPAGVTVDPVSCCPLTPGEVFQRYDGFECDQSQRDCTCTPADSEAQVAAGNCEGLGVVFPGVVEDWFQILRSGKRLTGIASSDSHSDHSGEPGWPRSFLKVPSDRPRNVSPDDIVSAIRGGEVSLSLGPFVLAEVEGTGLGGLVDASGKDSVLLDVEVRTAEWMGVDRLLVYLSGALVADKAIPADAPDVYRTQVEVPLAGDGFLVVEVSGQQNLFPVLYPSEQVPIRFEDALDAVGGSIGLGADADALFPVMVKPATPLAFTNPIWIDADGDGEVTPSLVLPEVSEQVVGGAVPAPPGAYRADLGPLPLPSLREASPAARAELRRMPRWLWPTSDPRDVRRLFWHQWRESH